MAAEVSLKATLLQQLVKNHNGLHPLHMLRSSAHNAVLRRVCTKKEAESLVCSLYRERLCAALSYRRLQNCALFIYIYICMYIYILMHSHLHVFCSVVGENITRFFFAKNTHETHSVQPLPAFSHGGFHTCLRENKIK